MSEEIAKKVEELKKEKELLDAEKAKLDAEKAKLDAEQALAAAKQPPVDPAAQTLKDLATEKAIAEARKASLEAEKARIEAAKALATSKQIDPSADAVKDLTAQKSLVDAQKALNDAQQQAWLSRVIGGDVKAGPYSGSVDVKDKAGTVEASLLAAHAALQCAEQIADTVCDHVEENTKVFLFKASEPPRFQKLMNFRFRRTLVQQAFAAANVPQPVSIPPDVLDSVPSVPFVAESLSVAAIGAGLGAVANILGFFKTDSTVGGIDANLDEALVVHTVAGAVREKLPDNPVQVPSLYSPKATADAVDALLSEIAKLVELRTLANAELKLLDPTSDKPRVDQLNAAIDIHDSFITYLTTADANGIAPLTAVAAEHAIWTELERSVVLLLRLEASGGGYLVKKNLWTGLGRMPLFHMGGAAVSYILFEGASGDVLAGGVKPVYGGYVRTDELQEHLAR